jgi:hypothetical protein
MSSKKRRLHDPHTVSFLCKLNYNEKKFLFKISEDQTCEEVFEKAKMHVHNYSENKNHGNHDLFLLEYYIGQDVKYYSSMCDNYIKATSAVETL